MQLDQVVLDSSCAFTVTATGFAPAATAAATCAEQTVTLDAGMPALKTSDCVSIIKYPTQSNAVRPIVARVLSATTIGVSFINPTAGSLTYATGDYVFRVHRL